MTNETEKLEVIEEAETGIKEYSKTEAALVDLEDRFKVVADCTTKDGYEFTRKAIAEVRGYRTSLDKLRKDLGKDARDHIAKLNSEAKRIIERLTVIELPMVEAKKAIDEEKDRIKAEEAEKETKRVSEIESSVKAIYGHANCSRTIDAINEAITEVESVDPDSDFFEEFTPAAKVAKEMSLETLYGLRDEAQGLVDEAERVAEEAAKQAEEKKKLDADRETMEAEKKAAQDKLDAQQAEMDKKQKAMDDQQAEIDRQEQEKKDAAAKEEQDKLDAEKAEKEAKEQAERDEEDRKQAAAKMLADKELFTKDSKTLESLSKSVAVIAKKEAGLNYDTPEATRISDEVLDMLNQSIHLIINSDVVKSQQEQEEGEK